MGTATKLAAYAAVLVVVGAAMWAVGNGVGAVGAVDAVGAPAPATEEHGGHAGGDSDDAKAGAPVAEEALPGGLTSSQAGYTLTPLTARRESGPRQEYAFRITGPDGKPVTSFELAHDKRMHLIAVRRDTAGYQHVHPVMDPDGTWRVPLDLSRPGSYRVFADFVPTGGEGLTLGTDLEVAGQYGPEKYPESRVARVDGYEVRLDGDLVPGRSAKLTLTVTRDGKPVTDLEPYLGAYGHLVALRGGDLAYLHVHPDGEAGDGRTAAGPRVVFHAEVPSAANYRMFLDFQHDGTVRTAEFTVGTAGAPAVSADSAPADSAGHADDGHGHGN